MSKSPSTKEKNTCSLDPGNYRGITLLSSFNKMSEIILWSRLEVWWHENNIITDNQGACKKCQSCLHCCLLMQEAVATLREAGKQCFVAYFDVAKAFDSIWINSLFYLLYKVGVTGRLRRILKKVYQNFKCKVRIQNSTFEWYAMNCGIHQRGYLSLL